MYIYIYISKFVCIYIYIYMYVSKFVCVYMYVYIYIYTMSSPARGLQAPLSPNPAPRGYCC